ncbi:CDP-diacylglycerol--serine O-phosphatidyltransferase [Rhodalgimonas zhirmunskyi]|uniref:CDP-diacylglycerol--serine O-phosphatidyltransferase n=1 Tax=Rhodalgimonas zhirmunskyi TaxID=2964767 RepID=A0AAJ1X4I0_9RHOB|nr:CDP-diacylglycerol--serine O-phosphatidyltransferase [Rhodoalgimonas zhirmunskyi]MDQ2093531.1 CDP-diacylglycerol--serine O-phosphatidyltransferase [Rhodoalgimonas zhirmunskyi]
MTEGLPEPDNDPENTGRRLRLVQLLPNMMTLAAICAGLTAMRFSFEGDAVRAMVLIVLAAVLDGLDGPTARLLKSESAIGAELDSLADFVNFGVAPGLILYFWVLQEGRAFGWIAVLIYAICCGLRLARFNVHSRSENRPKSPFFMGVPAPGAALLVLLPLVLSQVTPDWIDPILPGFTALWLLAVGLLMISRMPTPAAKSMRIHRDHAGFLMVAVVAVAGAFLTWPWPMLLVLELGYIAVLIVFALRHRGHHRHV